MCYILFKYYRNFDKISAVISYLKMQKSELKEFK